MDAPISPSGLDLLIKEWIWLSRDFRNQLSKRLHSRNSSPAVFTSLGLLSGSSPKHLNPAPPKSVAYRASPHKDWEHGKHTQPQPSKGKTDLRTVINSRRLREMVLTPEGSGQWGLPPRSRAVNTSFYGARLPSMSSGAGLPTLPPRVPQGAAVSGERISQGPPRNVVAFGMPAPSEEGFRAVSSDASCRFAVSGRRSDCTTRQSVAYRASPPKNGDTGSVLNRSRQKCKTDLRTVIISKAAAKKKKKKKTWRPRAQANEDKPPEVERSTPHFTVSVSLRCLQGTVLPTLPPRVLQGAAVSGERISQGPPGNVVALGCPPPPRRVSERSVQTLPVGSPFQNVVLTAQLHINPETSLERLVPLVEFCQRGNFCQIYLVGSCRL